MRTMAESRHPKLDRRFHGRLGPIRGFAWIIEGPSPSPRTAYRLTEMTASRFLSRFLDINTWVRIDAAIFVGLTVI